MVIIILSSWADEADRNQEIEYPDRQMCHDALATMKTSSGATNVTAFCKPKIDLKLRDLEFKPELNEYNT